MTSTTEDAPTAVVVRGPWWTVGRLTFEARDTLAARTAAEVTR